MTEILQVEGGGVEDVTMLYLMPKKILMHKFGREGCGVGDWKMSIWMTMIVRMLLLMHMMMKLYKEQFFEAEEEVNLEAFGYRGLLVR